MKVTVLTAAEWTGCGENKRVIGVYADTPEGQKLFNEAYKEEDDGEVSLEVEDYEVQGFIES